MTGDPAILRIVRALARNQARRDHKLVQSILERFPGATVEHFTQPCAECGKPISLQWTEHGLLPGSFVLVADWVFHPDCWNEKLAKNPPDTEDHPDGLA